MVGCLGVFFGVGLLFSVLSGWVSLGLVVCIVGACCRVSINSVGCYIRTLISLFGVWLFRVIYVWFNFVGGIGSVQMYWIILFWFVGCIC